MDDKVHRDVDALTDGLRFKIEACKWEIITWTLAALAVQTTILLGVMAALLSCRL